MKEFTFITTVKIAKDVAKLYPNYKINCFTPKSLAKRFASGNSPKNSLKDFGFEYKTKELKNVGNKKEIDQRRMGGHDRYGHVTHTPVRWQH
jgi:hypothetical protein